MVVVAVVVLVALAGQLSTLWKVGFRPRSCRSKPLGQNTSTSNHVSIRLEAVTVDEVLHRPPRGCVLFAQVGTTTPEFKIYQRQVVSNARTMASVIQRRGYKIVSGGTDNHLMLIDLSDKPYTGKDADAALSQAHITTNKNSVPNDPRSPFVTSGLRIGTPAVTTRGFTEPECELLADWLCDVLDALEVGNASLMKLTQTTREKVMGLCRNYPVYV